MLDIDPNRPDYDQAMELLASVPREPATVPLKYLISEIRLSSYSHIYNLVNRLNRRGIKIIYRKPEGGLIGLSVAKSSWPMAEKIAGEYLDAMWD